jgi:hypothetical protein
MRASFSVARRERLIEFDPTGFDSGQPSDLLDPG